MKQSNPYFSNGICNTSQKSEVSCGFSTRCDGKYVASLLSQHSIRCWKSPRKAEVSQVSRSRVFAQFSEWQNPCRNGTDQTRSRARTVPNISNGSTHTSNGISNTLAVPASCWTLSPAGGR